MKSVLHISLAILALGLASVSNAADTRDGAATQELSPAASGGHSTEGTDRGGKPAADSDAQAALLEWLYGLMD